MQHEDKCSEFFFYRVMYLPRVNHKFMNRSKSRFTFAESGAYRYEMLIISNGLIRLDFVLKFLSPEQLNKRRPFHQKQVSTLKKFRTSLKLHMS